MNIDDFVRDYWLSIDALDMERFLSFFTPDCTMGFGSYPLVHGLEGVRGMIAPVFAGVAGMRHQRAGAVGAGGCHAGPRRGDIYAP